MMKNVGSADKIIRIVVGIALIAFALFGPADIGWKWVGWIGVVPILTALMGWCPAYSVLGMRTCPMEKKSA
jgi:Inner membrane protein YgaP-like, transmembrane domain